MKLFQIEEPDGSPSEDAPGVAVGIDLSLDYGGAVALAMGGNAEILKTREGVKRLPVVGWLADGQWHETRLRDLLLALRELAEKALARPVTQAVIAITPLDDGARKVIPNAAAAAGIAVLGLLDRGAAAGLAAGAPAEDAPALGAAIKAEDEAASLLPR